MAEVVLDDTREALMPLKRTAKEEEVVGGLLGRNPAPVNVMVSPPFEDPEEADRAPGVKGYLPHNRWAH